MKRCVLCAMLLMLFLYSCNISRDGFSEIGNNHFTLLVPDNFIQPSDPQEDAIIHLCEDSADFLNGLSVVVYKDSINKEDKESTLYSYYNYVANNILDETLESGNLETPKDTVVNGLNALIFKTCGISNLSGISQNVCFFTGVFNGKHHFYEVTVWCTESKIPKYFKTIKKIIGSFKEK
jgi:hypothetical protein